MNLVIRNLRSIMKKAFYKTVDALYLPDPLYSSIRLKDHNPQHHNFIPDASSYEFLSFWQRVTNGISFCHLLFSGAYPYYHKIILKFEEFLSNIFSQNVHGMKQCEKVPGTSL